ncbi:MAG: DUF2283 domain-containing protein [Candidatus Bathyarchaeia archaeon]
MAESKPISDNLILDLNRKGEIIGVENFSTKNHKLGQVVFTDKNHNKEAKANRKLVLLNV